MTKPDSCNAGLCTQHENALIHSELLNMNHTGVFNIDFLYLQSNTHLSSHYVRSLEEKYQCQFLQLCTKLVFLNHQCNAQ